MRERNLLLLCFFFSFSFSFYVQGEQHAKKKKKNPSGVIYVVLNAQCQSKGFEPKYLACLSLLWLQGLPFICWIDLAVIVTRMGILWSFFVLRDKVTSSRSLEGGQGRRAWIRFFSIPAHELGPETLNGTFLMSGVTPLKSAILLQCKLP